MPLLVPVVTAAEGPELAPSPILKRPYLDDTTEELRIVLTRGPVELDDDGAVTNGLVLPSRWSRESPWHVMPGVDGFDVPASESIQQRAAGQFGSYVVGVDVAARELFMPVMLQAGSLTQMLTERDALGALISPYTGEPVRITVTRPDGTTRWIEGHRSGPSRPWDRGSFYAPAGRMSFGLTFTCPDPWWRGDPITPLKWSTPPSPSGSAFPLPWNVRADRIFNEPREIVVPGDVPGYPRITVDGPASLITARHVESGRSWVADGTLTASTGLVVDADPRVAATTGLQAVSLTGADRWSWIRPPFDLWELPPGRQTIVLDVVGTTTQSTAQLELVPLHETA